MSLSLHITVYTFNMQLFYLKKTYKTQIVHVTHTLHYTLHQTLHLRLYRIFIIYRPGARGIRWNISRSGDISQGR